MNIYEQIENMTDAEKAELLACDFGADLEKEAAADVAKADLAEALYAYGALLADQEVESVENLSKEASEGFSAAHQEITEAVEAGLLESGLLETEDTSELHKEAQAAAAIVFKGYADQVEKLASDEDKMAKMKKWMGEKAEAGKKHMKDMGAKAMKHKGKLGIGAAALAAGGAAYAYKKHHEKKASELSASELSDIVQEDQYLNNIITEGLSKLANAGEASATPSMMDKMKAGFKKHKDALKKHKDAFMGSKAIRHLSAHKAKYGLGALTLGGAGAAYAMHKKDKK